MRPLFNACIKACSRASTKTIGHFNGPVEICSERSLSIDLRLASADIDENRLEALTTTKRPQRIRAKHRVAELACRKCDAHVRTFPTLTAQETTLKN